MKLWAISDLHVRPSANRRFLDAFAAGAIAKDAGKDDWLILGGDLGETESDLELVIEKLAPRFAKLVWVPGNHELWGDAPRGVARYERLVSICRSNDVLTPEDPYVRWPGDGPPTVIAPLFLLYDYSFCPDDVGDPLAWAAEAGLVCTDEMVLYPDPYPSRAAWCHARCDATEARLAALPADVQPLIVNHFPLRRGHAFLPRVPRFSIWCGTRRTEDWHTRFRARAVVFGHLHLRQERVVDGVPFHEVSLGYPRQWQAEHQDHYVRRIL